MSDDLNNNKVVEEISQAEADDVLSKIDKESSFRKVAGIWALLVSGIAVLMSIYHLVTSSGWWMLDAMKHRSVHLTFLMVLTFLLYPAFGKKKKGEGPSVMDLVWLAFSAVSSIYLLFYFDEFSLRGTAVLRDYIMGGIVIVCTLEASVKRMLARAMV
ncbi:hypothetical protein AGMMS49957_14950 [Synergistales bacterium]|nr:hypothetical protein AGMMS49957_14950 [Synergistales bacterium]